MRETPPQLVDIAAWADSGSADPVRLRLRQAAHVLLSAIAAIHPSYTLYLKGGLLLGLVHNSPRITTDIDFTAGFPPRPGIDREIQRALNSVLPAAAAQLGYIGARAEVTKLKTQPKNFSGRIEKADFPALIATIRYDSKSAGLPRTDYFKIDISFNEPAPRQINILDIGGGTELRAYGPAEVIAEKYRSLLQQPYRKRNRRQDVYDLDFLLKVFAFDDGIKADILETIIGKCQARGINPNICSLDDPKIRRRAAAGWDSIRLEAGDLPGFESCFENVLRLYRDLPWNRL